MKALNVKSQKILEKLLAEMTDGYAKIDKTDGVFMAVVVEDVGGNCYSVAHYYEQQGDLVADTEVVFWKDAGKFYPIYYKTAWGDIDLVEFENGRPVLQIVGTQRDVANFCNQWMLNIKEQQKL